MFTPAIPVTGILPTRDRSRPLGRMLRSLIEQGAMPAELIIIDASKDGDTKELTTTFASEAAPLGCNLVYLPAVKIGAAAQRNQGCALATQPVLAFFDDDIIFEKDCMARLWSALSSDTRLGGVNATITNQGYTAPGLVSRSLFRLLAGCRVSSLPGRVIGPAVNLLPHDDGALPEVVSVDWLNLGATFYRREALPEPVFHEHFSGYSMCEDLALSLTVGKRWKLANARTARIFHDSQPGSYKSNIAEMSRMELVNRHYVMTEILGRTSVSDYLGLAVWEIFQLSAFGIQKRFGKAFWHMLKGKCVGAREIGAVWVGDDSDD